MSVKALFLCTDSSVFEFETKYKLKNIFRLYSSEEDEQDENQKKKKMNEAHICIINVIHHKDDLRLLNDLKEWKKICVLRHHESRNSSWCNNEVIKADAVVKYENRNELKDFQNIDELIKKLNSINIVVENDFKYYGKKLLRVLLFCLNQ
jgi:histidyl-tRNA synthetase